MQYLKMELVQIDINCLYIDIDYELTKEMSFKGKDGEELLVLRGTPTDPTDWFNLKIPFIQQYNGIDMKTGKLYVIIKWILQNENKIKEFIKNLEEEFNILLNIQHQYLIHYIGIKHEIVRGQHVIYLLRESFNCINYQSLPVKADMYLDLQEIRNIAYALLDLLSYFHERNVLFKNMDDCLCVYSVDEFDEFKIRVAYYSIDQQLSEFILQLSPCVHDKNTDIFRFGKFMHSIIDLDDDEKLEDIHPDLPDFIDKCMCDLENERWTALQLLEHKFLNTEAEDDSSDDDDSIQQSRFNTDFEEITPVGEGRFGQVYKAKQKSDHRIYAIKKILLTQKEGKSEGLSTEVQCLSRLNHENVVRYFNSWFEPCSPDDLNSSRSNSREYTYAGDDEDSTSYEEHSTNERVSSSGNVENENNVSIQRWLYIQMEYCENNTLRTEIEGGLYKNTDRIWQLFREIVEGLAYIHKEDLIHRDLTPENIFLDAKGRIKIGDFGLVTECKSNEESLDSKKQHKYLTGKIGTKIYVAPEMLLKRRLKYDGKVDVYSLGIIFFEMCHEHIETFMERDKIVGKLRTKDIELPEYFLTSANEIKVKLIQWLLNHNVEKRPTSMELLKSNYIPPRSEEIQNFRTKIKDMLNDPQLKEYKYLIESCFNQTQSLIDQLPTDFFEYFFKRTNKERENFLNKMQMKIENLFKHHGAEFIEMPPFMPKFEDAKLLNHKSVNLMTQSGNIVSLLHDLRTPFAYFVASKNITKIRRYSSSQTYQKAKDNNFHPESFKECAFDIVSPKPNLLNDVEVIYMLDKISIELLKKDKQLENSLTIYLNHTQLLNSVLLHCDVDKEKRQEVLNILADSNSNLENQLNAAGLSQKTVNQLLKILKIKGPINFVRRGLLSRMKDKKNIKNIVNDAFKELKNIQQRAKLFGVKTPLRLVLKLVHKNILQYSGVTYHLVNKSPFKVLAAGGQYDTLIQTCKSRLKIENEKRLSAVGFSVLLDEFYLLSNNKKATFIEEEEIWANSIKADLLQILWKNDVQCFIIDTKNNVDFDKIIQKLNQQHVILISDEEEHMVILRSKIDKETYIDEKFDVINIGRELRQKFNIKEPICASWSDTNYPKSSDCVLL